MKRIAIGLMLLTVVLAFFASPGRVRADEPSYYEIGYDETAGADHPWPPSTWYPIEATLPYSPDAHAVVFIVHNTGSDFPCVVVPRLTTSEDVWVFWSSTSLSIPVGDTEVCMGLEGACEALGYDWWGGFEAIPVPEESEGTDFSMYFEIGWDCVGSALIDHFRLIMDDAPPYFRPVQAGQELLDTTSGGDVWNIATDPGAKVYAVGDAIVASVTLDADGYTVGLLVNGTTYVLYGHLATAFADLYDEIDGGCVLGYAGPGNPDDPINTGYFAYMHNYRLGDWHDFAESLSETPCNIGDSNCLNINPDFNNNAESWLGRYGQIGSLNFTGGDFDLLLPKGVQAYQSGFAVELADTYYVTVAARMTGVATSGQLTAWIGGVEAVMTINTLGGEYAVVTSQALSPAFAGTSEFRLTNTSPNNAGMRITFACLHTGDVVVAPPACYFADAGLTTDTFETEGSAVFEDSIIGIGRYSIPPGDAIRAPVDFSAFSDVDTDFNLLIQGAAPSGATDVTASIVDSDTDDELQAIGNYPYSTLFFAELVRTFTVPSGTHLVGDLLIENTGDQTVVVSALCLTPVGGLWPGFENPDLADHSLLPTNCEECTFPESLLDVVAWLNWLGCVFRYLIFCLLCTLVNNVWNTVLAIMSGIGLFGRWLGRAISIIVEWAWRAGGRLLATLISSAIPILNAIMAWILSLPFVRDLLDAASVAGLWINGIIAFIVGVINLFVAAVRFVGVLITLVGTAWVAFIQGLSGSSEFTAILPDCYDSGSPFYDVCLVLDVLNFVVSQVIAVAVLFGAVAISIVWRTAAGIKDDIERVFES